MCMKFIRNIILTSLLFKAHNMKNLKFMRNGAVLISLKKLSVKNYLF